jgi:hypothetical protein
MRPFTPTEEKIAAGLIAGLDYDTLGQELGGIQARTVRGHVEAMHRKIIGLEDLEPRHAIVTYFLWMDWSRPIAAGAR